jgi:hypothetical protein
MVWCYRRDYYDYYYSLPYYISWEFVQCDVEVSGVLLVYYTYYACWCLILGCLRECVDNYY